jgi:hypothetical protein
MESSLIGDPPLEQDGAGEAKRRGTATGIVEAIAVTGQRVDGFESCPERERQTSPLFSVSKNVSPIVPS